MSVNSLGINFWLDFLYTFVLIFEFMFTFQQNYICTDNEWLKIWSVLSKDEKSIQHGTDSVWMKLEGSFNELNKNFVIKTPLESKLRLVIDDDDKIRCESTMKRYWSTN